MSPTRVQSKKLPRSLPKATAISGPVKPATSIGLNLQKEQTRNEKIFQSGPPKPSSASVMNAALLERLAVDPKQTRRALASNYEGPRSEREGWWRTTIKDTPLPGAYNVHQSVNFVNDIAKRNHTYTFKSDGRRREPLPQVGRGEYLLPGAYSYDDFGSRLKNVRHNYAFKNRVIANEKTKLHVGPEVDLSPFSYDTSKYLSVDSDNEPVKHSMFKSKEKRAIFKPKDGPSPGDYDNLNFVKGKSKEITSSFQSESIRFGDNQTIGPGPGAYEPISAWIPSKQSQQFNTKGVFFTSSAKITT